MPAIKILSDSSSDLSQELIRKYEIGVIPFYINLGGKTLRDGIDISAEDIYAYVAKGNPLPGTIANSIEDYTEVFRKWRAQGYEIICTTLSSDMSCSYQNAKIAADEVGGVHVIDSRNLSTGHGHLTVNAAIMASKGMAADDICRAVNTLAAKVRSSFILDNLEYMRKGGRCSSVMLLGANLLKIKPEIVVEDGSMKVGRKYRGPLGRVLEEYVDERLEGMENKIRSDRIFITHTGCSKELVDLVRARIEKHMHFDEVLETRAGSTVTSHSGPNTLGILYIEK